MVIVRKKIEVPEYKQACRTCVFCVDYSGNPILEEKRYTRPTSYCKNSVKSMDIDRVEGTITRSYTECKYERSFKPFHSWRHGRCGINGRFYKKQDTPINEAAEILE